MAQVRRFAWSVAFLLALLGVAGDAAQQTAPAQSPQADQAAADPPRPVFRTGISYVRVDVIVTDKSGNAIPDLKATDFEVSEDGHPQAVDTFKLIKLEGGTVPATDGPPRAITSDNDEEMEAARDDVRLFAIFLDDYHVRLGSSLSVREPLTKFIAEQVRPSDMVGLMYPLQPLTSVRMSRNHATIMKALEQFTGRKGDYVPRNAFEEQYARYPPEMVEQVRNQVSLSALRSLIVHMGSLKEGRKALILVSEGYSRILPPQLRGGGLVQDDLTESRNALFAGADMQRDLQEVYDAANRNNVAIYPVDPRGLAVNEFGIDQNVGRQTDAQFLSSSVDTLRTLAENSDGRAIVNRNDIAVGMRQIVRDSSAYYLIGYNSTQTPSDGKFHEIKVRLKRPGLQVRARKGYRALTAENVARALAPPKPGPSARVVDAVASVNRPSRAQVVRTWVGTTRGENGKTRVTFVWEPVPLSPGRPAGAASDVAARVSVTAVGSDGAPYFRGKVPEVSRAQVVPAALQTAAAGRPGSMASFEVAPGPMELRVSVETVDAQVIDSETREIIVPDLSAASPSFGTPQVFRARTVRELQQLKADRDSVPTAAREFGRTERVLVQVPVYGAMSAHPGIAARLLNRTGQAMMDVPVSAGAEPSLFQMELPLAGLVPGEYVLEIKGGSEGRDVADFVGFRVT